MYMDRLHIIKGYGRRILYVENKFALAYVKGYGYKVVFPSSKGDDDYLLKQAKDALKGEWTLNRLELIKTINLSNAKTKKFLNNLLENDAQEKELIKLRNLVDSTYEKIFEDCCKDELKKVRGEYQSRGYPI